MKPMDAPLSTASISSSASFPMAASACSGDTAEILLSTGVTPSAYRGGSFLPGVAVGDGYAEKRLLLLRGIHLEFLSSLLEIVIAPEPGQRLRQVERDYDLKKTAQEFQM